ncbi:hypothetical protein [Rhizobium sp. E27B/91]|uniref:hypothetical protein n=1 Tax=Rhizobium sp. E27B/91 TaxID=2819995 RepID=UPI0032AFCE98
MARSTAFSRKKLAAYQRKDDAHQPCLLRLFLNGIMVGILKRAIDAFFGFLDAVDGTD